MSLDESNYPNPKIIGDVVKASAKDYLDRTDKGETGEITPKKKKDKKRSKPDSKKAFNFLKSKGKK